MLEAVLTLVIMTALLLGSPGPAPLALAATSASFGISRGVPFLLGILSGLLFALVAAVIGLATLFSAYPSVKLIMQLLGSVYIVFIAYKLASAPVVRPSQIEDHSDNVPSFKDGFILNILNPKAYAAFLAIFAQFLLPFENTYLSSLITGLICMLVATIVDIIWLCLGGVLGGLFQHKLYARFLRVVFAALMIGAVSITLLSSLDS